MPSSTLRQARCTRGRRASFNQLLQQGGCRRRPLVLETPREGYRVVGDKAHKRPSLIRSLIFRPPRVTPRLASSRPRPARRAFARSKPGPAGTSFSYGFAAPRNDDLLSIFHPIQQRPEPIFCLKRSNLVHENSSTSQQSSLSHAEGGRTNAGLGSTGWRSRLGDPTRKSERPSPCFIATSHKLAELKTARFCGSSISAWAVRQPIGASGRLQQQMRVEKQPHR